MKTTSDYDTEIKNETTSQNKFSEEEYLASLEKDILIPIQPSDVPY